MISLSRKYPILFGFLKNRLDKNHFFGRTFTYLLLIFVYLLFNFIGVIVGFLRSDIITFVDLRLLNLLEFFRNDQTVEFFLWITVLGNYQVVFLFFLVGIAILWLLNKYVYILPLAVTIAGGSVCGFLLKFLFHRPRPELAVYVENSYSFPSGHATIAVALFGFFVYVIWREIKLWKIKIIILALGVILATLIGFSRLYLGVHYFSDVFGGHLLGGLWLLIGIGLAEYWSVFGRSQSYLFVRRPTKNKLMAVLILIVALFGYVFLALNFEPIYLSASAPVTTQTVSEVMNIFSTEQLRYSETLRGNRQEPIHFIILAKSDSHLESVFKKAGWKTSEILNLKSAYKLAKTVIFKLPYDTAPITPSFWDAKTNDFGFQKPTSADNIRERHHARFWKTQYITEDEYILYIGTSSFDQGIKWRQMTHYIAPDIDTERELVWADLNNAQVIDNYSKIKMVAPVLGKNFTGDDFFTDGYSYIIKLKSP